MTAAVATVTGRAGHAGEAITFFTESDAPKLRSVARLAAEAGSEVPEWMLHMEKQKNKRKGVGGGLYVSLAA